MANQKNNKGVIILLIVIIVILSVLCVLFATDTISFNSSKVDNDDNTIENDSDVVGNNSNETQSVMYTYDEIKGLYSYTSETFKDEYGNEYQAGYNLYLYENGTFNYRMGTTIPWGYMGNYIIKDDTIVLNYLFSTGSDVGLNVITGSKIITITDSDTLVDVNQSITDIKVSSVTLEKATSSESNEFLKTNDFSYFLDNGIIENKASLAFSQNGD